MTNHVEIQSQFKHTRSEKTNIEINFEIYKSVDEMLNGLPAIEIWEVGRETRPEGNGFRVIRRVLSPVDDGDPNYNWDEWYMFYQTLDEVLTAAETGDCEKGVQDF